MNVTIKRYSTVFVNGTPDARATCEAYLYSATVIDEDGTYEHLDGRGATFVLVTSASFDCADSALHDAAEKAARTALELRKYQLARFESGLHPTAVFATRHGAQEAALETAFPIER